MRDGTRSPDGGSSPAAGAPRAGTEIERRFLVAERPPGLADDRGERIEQGYLAGSDGVEVRIRRRAARTTLTVKHGSGIVRAEEEVDIEADRFERLWPLTEGRRLEKVRHRLPAGAAEIELDVYGGALRGLMVAEVEFGSERAAAAWTPPPWLGREVTGEPAYRNERLAREGLPPPLAPKPEFALSRDETVAEGVRRVADGQLAATIARLEGRTGEDAGVRVHEARKALKRLRALVRLTRDDLGARTARREQAGFRDAGRELAGARDAQVLVETLDAVCRRAAGDIPDGVFEPLRTALAGEHERLETAARDDGTSHAAVVARLQAARARLGDWSLSEDGAEALSDGIERIYRRGRRALAAARAHPDDAERLHELRKRVKDLWYASQLVEPVADSQAAAAAKAAKGLSEVLGEEHDLAVLADATRQRQGLLDDCPRALLDQLIGRRRDRLRVRALADAERLYARKPRRMVRSFKLGR